MTAFAASSITNGVSSAPPRGASAGVAGTAAAPNVFPVIPRDHAAPQDSVSWERIEDWSVVHNQIFRLPLAMLVDSPYQPANRYQYRYDPEEIRHLAALMADEGQVDKLLVRWVNGKFEIIAGHRRRRAAELLGWEGLDALVVLMDDARAHLTCRMHNFGRTEPTDYECACVYRDLLAEHTGPRRITQSMLAGMAGLTQGTVSKLLRMLELPRPILALLDEKPDLFGHNAAAVIARLVDEHPEEIELITRAVARLRDGAEQQSIRGWVKQMLAQRCGTPLEREDRSYFVLAPDNSALVTGTVVGRCVRLQVHTEQFSAQDVLERAVRLLQDEFRNNYNIAKKQ